MAIRFHTNVPSSESVDERSRTSSVNVSGDRPAVGGSRSRHGAFQSLSQLGSALRQSGVAPRRANPAQIPTASSAANVGGAGIRTGRATRQGQTNPRAAGLLNVGGAALTRPVSMAGKAVRRFAKRLTARSQRAAPAAAPAVAARPVALNVPRDYGWPLGLMERQRLETLSPDQAYVEAFKTHLARVDHAVGKSADARFGFSHIDNNTLREQLHAWRNGEDGELSDDEVPWRPASESEIESDVESEAQSQTMSRTDSNAASPGRESEIQSVHSSPARDAAQSGEAGASRTRRVHFAPQAEAREIGKEFGALEPEVTRFAIHSLRRESVKLKGHMPESPEFDALYRQRSLNGAAWDTVARLKSPRFGPEDKKMTADMLKQNKLLFAIKRQYKLAPEDEAAAVKLVHTLDRETSAPSFSAKVKGLLLRLSGKGSLPDPLKVPGEDDRYEVLQRANSQ